MIIINNIDTKKFSLDGIPYFKNYISEVAGNSIRIFNAYDKNDIRVDYTNFANIELDGVVYGSVALLQDALLEVIYTRSSLGGGGGGSAEWGSIIGDIEDQTDLKNALDAKQDVLTETNFATFTNALDEATYPLAGNEVVPLVQSGVTKFAKLEEINKEKLDEKEFTLTAGANITIDRTVPEAPVISASGGGGSTLITPNLQTANYTLVLTDLDKIIQMDVATSNNLTVPLNSSVAFAIGTVVYVSQYGVGRTTIVATGGVTIKSFNNWTKSNGQNSLMTLLKINTDEWLLSGEINA